MVIVLAAIGFILMIVGFATGSWIPFLLAAIVFVVLSVVIYRLQRAGQPLGGSIGEWFGLKTKGAHAAEPRVSKDTDSAEKIGKLAELRDAGVITADEFEEKQAKITQDADSASKIGKLAELRDAGVITADEFEEKRAQILQGGG